MVRYRYDGWGNHKVMNPDGSKNESDTFIGNINPFRYRGYYYDVETGLYYLKTRYYDPETGRFITIDDISYLAPDTINGLNLYAYCGNNPITYIDITGRQPEVSIGIDIWSISIVDKYIWRSGRYKPRRAFKYGNHPFKYFGNNLLYIGELFLNMFELNFGGYRFSALNFNSGITLISGGFDLLDGRMYISEVDYLGVKVGTLNLDFIDIQPNTNNYTLLDAQATLLTIGAYSEYVDVEILVGSVGATFKIENGKLTVGFSWGWGIKFTIKL